MHTSAPRLAARSKAQPGLLKDIRKHPKRRLPSTHIPRCAGGPWFDPNPHSPQMARALKRCPITHSRAPDERAVPKVPGAAIEIKSSNEQTCFYGLTPTRLIVRTHQPLTFPRCACGSQSAGCGTSRAQRRAEYPMPQWQMSRWTVLRACRGRVVQGRVPNRDHLFKFLRHTRDEVDTMPYTGNRCCEVRCVPWLREMRAVLCCRHYSPPVP